MKPKHQRLILIVLGLISLAFGVTLLLRHFNEQLVFFYDPTQLQTASIKEGQLIRVGGLVKEQSVIYHKNPSFITFIITDGNVDVPIRYEGLLPNLFREGQGMVAQGVYHQDGVLEAVSLLAKHDENYMPPEVSESLKKRGYWKPEQ